MTDQLISFETAKLAKEKGFNIKHYWYNDIRPTQSLLQKWLREKHGIHIVIQKYGNVWSFEIVTDITYSDDILYFSFEKALEGALYQALNRIK
jgi:Mg2+/Co2+ transporter CorB